jgi:predicted CoA-binding protein
MSQADTIEKILKESKTIAVVGLSPDPTRPSHGVARYLQGQGYRIVLVNPMSEEALGEKSYPDLASVPEAVDVVDIFRRAEHVPAIVEAAIAKGAKAVWMQEGIVHEEAAARAREAGLMVVMNRCMFKEHHSLFNINS